MTRVLLLVDLWCVRLSCAGLAVHVARHSCERELEVMQELKGREVVGVSGSSGERRIVRTVQHQAAQTSSPAKKTAKWKKGQEWCQGF